MLSYSIPPHQITLRHFFDLTKKRKMLPSRVMLQQNMEERFAQLSKMGIDNLANLLKTLGSTEKLEKFARQSGMGPDYLSLLRREARSYQAKPFPLSNFPGIPFEYTELLKSKGIGHTRSFFELAQTEIQREEMARKTGIPKERIKELYVLCDLSRITGVGAAMARMVYEAGIRSTADFAVTEERFEEHLGEDDIQYCLSYAKVITAMDQKNN